MKKIAPSLLVMICISLSASAQLFGNFHPYPPKVLGPPLTAKERAEYGAVIDLSLKIKAVEKRLWNVAPGDFATKMPVAKTPTSYRIIAQKKFDLVRDYLGADNIITLDVRPTKAALRRMYPNSDIVLYGVVTSDMDDVDDGIAGDPPVEQILIIAHEDFHHYRGARTTPRRIDESFANAFSYHSEKLLLEELGDTRLEAAAAANLRSARKRVRNGRACFYALDVLYKSPISRKKKLLRRTSLLKECSAKIGFKVNNAVLVEEITYAQYFDYAWDKLERYGPKRFLAAYTSVPSGIKNETLWLGEFERRLNAAPRESPQQ